MIPERPGALPAYQRHLAGDETDARQSSSDLPVDEQVVVEVAVAQVVHQVEVQLEVELLFRRAPGVAPRSLHSAEPNCDRPGISHATAC